MIFDGALQDAITKGIHWKPLDTALHDISVFMANNGLKMRFIALCVRPKSRAKALALERDVAAHFLEVGELASILGSRSCSTPTSSATAWRMTRSRQVAPRSLRASFAA